MHKIIIYSKLILHMLIENILNKWQHLERSLYKWNCLFDLLWEYLSYMKALFALFMKTVSVLGQIPNLGKMTMNPLPELEINY